MFFNKILKPKKPTGKPKKYYIPVENVFCPLTHDIINSNHTLIAGTTGSGKSVLLNIIICEFLMNKGVNNKLYLIDPKRVELSIYKDLPHVAGYTYDTNMAILFLDNIIKIIDIRYQEMEKNKVRTYTGDSIYLIIDELADIMISNQSKEFKVKLQKILQIGRACKVHVIACTQCPNRKVIPAEIVLNFTNRVALRCLSGVESRQIINISGAENLPQYGKGFYLSPKDGIKLIDIPFLDENKINNIINQWFTKMVCN